MNMKIFNKKFAFTLSEVMITLSLIGFIATMTLSTVGASIQQRAREAEFRSAYSKMEAAIRNITYDEGKIYNCYICPTNENKTLYGLSIEGCSEKTNQCEDLAASFVRAMGATHFCETNPINEGCLPANYPAAPGGDCFSSFDSGKAYVLDNSMIIIFDTDQSLRLFAVDINGRKGPNKWGQDIFTFSLYAKDSKKINNKNLVTNVGLLPPKTCLPVGSAGVSSEELLKNSMNYK